MMVEPRAAMGNACGRVNHVDINESRSCHTFARVRYVSVPTDDATYISPTPHVSAASFSPRPPTSALFFSASLLLGLGVRLRASRSDLMLLPSSCSHPPPPLPASLSSFTDIYS